jgi:tRNA threonylcarbamoyladenosine biosynthesis protein TsaE
VFGVSGELGSGKTQLIKGIALGLGIPARVHSPTFALIHTYPGGRLCLYHVDLYRLVSRDQIIDAGLEQYIRNPDGVAAVEWADRWWTEEPILPRIGPPPVHRRVQIESIDSLTRRITYEDPGV